MPVFRDRASRTDFFTVSGDDAVQIQFSRGLGKPAASSAIVSPGPQALIDTVPGNTSTTATLTVDATPIISAVDTIADEDFYSIQLIAGHQYQIGMYGYTPQGPGDPAGPNGSPLLDSYLELYDSAGTLITSADGGSDTTINAANSGFDALLTFTATTTGTYYVNARAFDNIPLDGDNGDMTGDYGLYAEDVTGDESLYTPYYQPTEPLYAIDWGTQVNKVNQTARNPDGNEGTRTTASADVDPTGNAQGTPTYTSLFDVPALAAAQGKDISGKNVITIYFAKVGDVFVSNDPANPGLPPATITAVAPQDFERLAVFTALHEFEKAADIVYLEVQDRNHADFIYTSYQGTPGPGVSLLGSMSPPDESDEGLAQFNSGDYRWNAIDLQQGGFSFTTLIHEFGHGHGLAHPHDNGGHSGIMNGVVPEGAGVADYTTGDYDLNQGVFTMMSYEDGWQDSPYGNAPTTGGYGYLGGLMAFDIAAIQDKYGVNEDWATGNDTYVIKDVNAPGTYYTAIWDGGGNDSIVYSGARNANIDLRAASLEYEYGGGGWVSFALGIYGGFTIANGVTIENAVAGSGNDTLTGNSVANVLNGGAGADSLAGLAGDDVYYVDNLGDVVSEASGEGRDVVYSSISYALAAGASVEILSTISVVATNAIDLTGNGIGNVIYGNAGANALNGSGGADYMVGFGGDDVYFVDTAGDIVVEDVNGGRDVVYSSSSYILAAGSSVEILSTISVVGTDAIDLTGNGIGNVLYGNAGVNALNGAAGADYMVGFGGDDVYLVDTAGDIVVEEANGGRDVVYASSSYTLAAGSSVEVLSTGGLGETTAIDLTGNALGNVLFGNAGANVLNGGAGADYLAGFGGADTFAFTTALGGGNVDYLTDFRAVDDTFALDDAVFGGLAPGALSAGAFVAGAAAADADDRIIYNSATGQLLFDADGNGAGAAVLFATVDAGTIITAADFMVI